MNVLLTMEPILREFDKRDDVELNRYLWEFYEGGLRGVIRDYFSSEGKFWRHIERQPEPFNMSSLGEHLVYAYDSWVERNPPIYGVMMYEYTKNVCRLELIGELLDDYLNELLLRYFKQKIEGLTIKSCRWVTGDSILLEIKV